MTIIFTSSFETGDTSSFDAVMTDTTTNIVVVASKSRTGNYACQFNATAIDGTAHYARVRKDFPATSLIHIATGVLFPTGSISSLATWKTLWVLQVGNSSLWEIAARVGVTRTPTGYAWVLLGYDSAGQLVETQVPATISEETYYFVELRDVRGAGNGEEHVWVQGTEIIAQNGLTNNTVVPSLNMAWFGLENWSQTTPATLYLDDISIGDSYIGTTTPTQFQLNVGASPISVAVTIDGASVGNTPYSAPLSSGQHTVSVPVSYGGYTFVSWQDGVTTAQRTITLSANLSLTATYTNTTPPPPTAGRLHTEGRWVKDASGTIVRLQGAAIFWRFMYTSNYTDYDPLAYPDEISEQSMDTFKTTPANFIRFTVNGYLYHIAKKPKYIAAVDTVVQWCKARGIMVMLDNHGWWNPDANSSYKSKPQLISELTEWRDFMVELATKYKSEPTVIGFDLFNEPGNEGGLTWALWRANALSVCQAIHAVDPTFVISVEPILSGTEEGDLDNFLNQPLPERNIIYSIHNYLAWDYPYQNYAISYGNGDFATARTQMESLYYRRWLKAIDYNLPVMQMETAIYRDPAVNPNAEQWLVDSGQLYRNYSVGVSYWTFDPDRTDSSLISLLNADRVTLTHVGQIWLADMLNPTVTHNLTVDSTPQAVSITVDGYGHTTPSVLVLGEGQHTVVAPSTVVIGADTYNFVRWDDGSTSTTRTVNLTANATVTATYQIVSNYPLSVMVREGFTLPSSHCLNVYVALPDVKLVGALMACDPFESGIGAVFVV